MKNNSLRVFAIVTVAVLLTVAAIASGITTLNVLALPFTLLGKGLRALSLSGVAGNIAAIIIYAAVCLCPLLLKIRRKWTKKDILIPICSGLMFYTVYLMINPTLRPMLLQNDVGDIGLAFAVYSVLICWVILSLADSFKESNNGNVYSVLHIFFLLLMATFAVAIATGLSDCISSVREISENNTAEELNLIPTYIFTVISCGVTVLEYCLDIWLIRLSDKLLGQIRADAYSEGCLNASRSLSLWCRRGLVIVAISSTALNVAQILFAGFLYNADVNVDVPLFSIALFFALMALTRLLQQGKTIKEDIDLFV